MNEETKQKLIEAGRTDLVEAFEITISGYAGILPFNGMIVDRRKFPQAIAAKKNELLGIPESKEIPEDYFKTTEEHWYTFTEDERGRIKWEHWNEKFRDMDLEEDNPKAFINVVRQKPIMLNDDHLKWYSESELNQMTPEQRKSIEL